MAGTRANSEQPGQGLGHRTQQSRAVLAVERIAGGQPQCCGDERGLGLVPDGAVLEAPGDQRLALLGEPEDPAAKVIPLLGPTLILEGTNRLGLGFAEDTVCVAIPARRHTLDPRRRQRAAVLEEPVDL